MKFQKIFGNPSKIWISRKNQETNRSYTYGSQDSQRFLRDIKTVCPSRIHNGENLGYFLSSKIHDLLINTQELIILQESKNIDSFINVWRVPLWTEWKVPNHKHKFLFIIMNLIILFLTVSQSFCKGFTEYSSGFTSEKKNNKNVIFLSYTNIAKLLL